MKIGKVFPSERFTGPFFHALKLSCVSIMAVPQHLTTLHDSELHSVDSVHLLCSGLMTFPYDSVVSNIRRPFCFDPDFASAYLQPCNSADKRSSTSATTSKRPKTTQIHLRSTAADNDWSTDITTGGILDTLPAELSNKIYTFCQGTLDFAVASSFVFPIYDSISEEWSVLLIDMSTFTLYSIVSDDDIDRNSLVLHATLALSFLRHEATLIRDKMNADKKIKNNPLLTAASTITTLLNKLEWNIGAPLRLPVECTQETGLIVGVTVLFTKLVGSNPLDWPELLILESKCALRKIFSEVVYVRTLQPPIPHKVVVFDYDGSQGLGHFLLSVVHTTEQLMAKIDDLEHEGQLYPPFVDLIIVNFSDSAVNNALNSRILVMGTGVKEAYCIEKHSKNLHPLIRLLLVNAGDMMSTTGFTGMDSTQAQKFFKDNAKKVHSNHVLKVGGEGLQSPIGSFVDDMEPPNPELKALLFQLLGCEPTPPPTTSTAQKPTVVVAALHVRFGDVFNVSAQNSEENVHEERCTKDKKSLLALSTTHRDTAFFVADEVVRKFKTKHSVMTVNPADLPNNVLICTDSLLYKTHLLQQQQHDSLQPHQHESGVVVRFVPGEPYHSQIGGYGGNYDPTDPQSVVKETARVAEFQSTLLELHELISAESIESHSVYSWGSGFVQFAAWLGNSGSDGLQTKMLFKTNTIPCDANTLGGVPCQTQLRRVGTNEIVSRIYSGACKFCPAHKKKQV